ncbi:hypothetical protein BD560DRAFT_308985, partial [Blakeslea trispora]
SNNQSLPSIPLSPIAQSYIISFKELNQVNEKLAEAKRADPPVPVASLRGLIETSKIEERRLSSLLLKMQSLEAATPLYWDANTLARQIAVTNCQLFNQVFLDKRSLSQLDLNRTKLVHLVDFHNYLSHSMAHQLIYWVELLSNQEAASAVVPFIQPNKDSLVAHLVRVAYLLLHAYRDFSGLAAIMKALTFPEVRRLNKKLWAGANSRTKDMFRDLVQIISPARHYQAYHHALRSKLEQYTKSSTAMIAIPWIHPHLLSIRSIVSAYTAGDNEDLHHTLGDIVLSAPGAHKLDLELALMELCQLNAPTGDFATEDILSTHGYELKPNRRGSTVLGNNSNSNSNNLKALHIEGLRSAVLPVPNLNHLAPGDEHTQHWLVSRVYLRKDQLINESIEVELLKPGETITCEEDKEDAPVRHLAPIFSNTTSRRASLAQPQTRTASILDISEESGFIEQRLIHTVQHLKKNEDTVAESSKQDVSSHLVIEEEEEEEEDTVQKDNKTNESIEKPAQEEDSLTEPASEEEEALAKSVRKHKVTSVVGQEDKSVQEGEIKNPESSEQKADRHLSASTTESTRQANKSKLSPTAPVFIPNKAASTQKTESVATNTTDEWLGYPMKEEEEEVATVATTSDSEKWVGYPAPDHGEDDDEDDDDDDEVWKGYPGPNSNTNSPRRDSSQSETSEEWKGYHATKMEADWQRESALKVQEHEWQGYALETLDEDELDSSTMMDGEFEKSRQARGHQRQQNKDQVIESFRRRRH